MQEETIVKVLIAEDNAQNMYMARFLLENSGHSVIEAGDGEQAVRLADECKPDVILMDMQLPKLDGYGATTLIKANEHSCHIPVIAFTALAMKGDEEKTRDAGCDAYISKPIDPATFVQQIEAVV